MAPVAVVRAPNWFGDTVMALPALAALRAGWPAARITVVGRWAPLLAGQGVADVLIEYPRPWAARHALARRLREDRADWMLLLPNSLEAALGARLARARRIVGYATDGRRLLLTDAPPLPSPRRHQVDEYLELTGAVGPDPARDPAGQGVPAWRLVADAAAAREAGALLDDASAGGAGSVIGLHLGSAGGPAKQWAPESVAALADRLGGQGLMPLLLGAPADAAAAARVRSVARRPPASLVGRDRPDLLPHLLSRLDGLVSGDTGVAHLAAALGLPTVTLFGPTDPRLTAPRGRLARALHAQAPCAPCFLARCPIDHVCLRAIAPDDVARSLQELLAERATETAVR